MEFQIIGRNIVAVANRFNPSIFNKYWLNEKGVIKADDFAPGSLVTDELVLINSDVLQLQVAPPQLSVTPKDVKKSWSSVEDVALKIFNLLPETPINGLGVNCHYRSGGTEIGGFNPFLKSLFYKAESRVFRMFDADDCSFGGYMSKDFETGRLKLNIKPVTVSKEVFVDMSFNYHLDLEGNQDSGKRLEIVERHIETSTKFFEEAQRIVDSVEDTK